MAKYTPSQERFIALMNQLIAAAPTEARRLQLQQLLTRGTLDPAIAEKTLAQLDKQTEKPQQKERPHQIQGVTILGKSLETAEDLAVRDKDRQSGMYVLGVQGVGKSSLLEQLVYQDICKGYSVIVLDPHGDLIEHVIAQMPEQRLAQMYVLDVEDTAFPFGVNLFGVGKMKDTDQAQAIDRILHVFEKCFPDTSRMLLEKYLGNIAPVFFANAERGLTLTDIPKFLRDEGFRQTLLQRVRFFVREFWEEEYNSMSPSKRQTEAASLATRINRFMRSPIVGNIIGQSTTTINFRRAIENKEILLINAMCK